MVAVPASSHFSIDESLPPGAEVANFSVFAAPQASLGLDRSLASAASRWEGLVPPLAALERRALRVLHADRRHVRPPLEVAGERGGGRAGGLVRLRLEAPAGSVEVAELEADGGLHLW